MHVYWLEQTGADVPSGVEWLTASERLRLNAISFPKRRIDWCLGRWTAKSAYAAYLNSSAKPELFREMEIRPATHGAPELFFRNNPAAAVISLSHRAGKAICAVAPSGAVLGCDLELVEPRSDAFLADYFAVEEQALVAHAPVVDRFRLLALLWSAKESALKALHEGLRLDTRCMIVDAIDGLGNLGGVREEFVNDSSVLDESARGLNGWRQLQVRHVGGLTYHGWWKQTGNFVTTLVAAPAPHLPIQLTQSCCRCKRELLVGVGVSQTAQRMQRFEQHILFE
jgi:4'-phosphopantetheinyl transferase